MYEFILRERLVTVLATVFVAVFASSLVGSYKCWFRGLLYSFTPAMGAAFYAVAFLAQPQPNSVDLVAGLFFETTVLAIFYRQILRLKRNIVFIGLEDADRALWWSLIVQLLISLPNVTAGGFGIWSNGSRLDYLTVNSLAKYLTYAGFLISAVQVAFLASLVSNRGDLGALGWVVILTNFALSMASGSKGGVFLWLMSIASMIDYGRARIPTYKIFTGLIILSIAIFAFSVVAADFLGLDLKKFGELATSRFFLNNDARALALELRTSQSANLSFFSEAFRSLGNLIDMPPKNDPLGVIVYRDGLSMVNGNGANTSFMALATYYYPVGYALFPAFLGVIGAILISIAADYSSKYIRGSIRRPILTSIWIAAISTYSQDFLSFQILVPLIVLVVLVSVLLGSVKWTL